MKKWINDENLTFTASRGSKFMCSRSDLRYTISVIRPQGMSDNRFATEVSEFIWFHTHEIRPHLNGFSGYDTLDYDITEV